MEARGKGLIRDYHAEWTKIEKKMPVVKTGIFFSVKATAIASFNPTDYQPSFSTNGKL